MSHTLQGLRAHLFDAIDRVKAGTITIEQARTISDLSQVVVNTAKVEIDYLRGLEGDHATSPFLAAPAVDAGQTIEERELPAGTVRIVQHRLKG